MRSIPRRRLLPALLLLSCLSTGCTTISTRPSLGRTDRPALPPLPEALTRTETLRPLTARPDGDLVSVPKGVFAELLERLAEAIGAVGRLNGRLMAVRQERTCTDTILRTGTAPADCPNP